MTRLALLLPLSLAPLHACDTSGGTCRDDDVCIEFADSVDNGTGSESCGLLLSLAKSYAIEESNTEVYTVLRDTCPDGDVVGECAYDGAEGTKGVAVFYGPTFTAESAEESCLYNLEGTFTP